MHYSTLIFTVAVTALSAVAVPMHHAHSESNTLGAGNAYSGAGGSAPGGSVSQGSGVNSCGTLLSTLSNNAGSGGNAGSGDAMGGSLLSRWNKPAKAGDAYTGVGGQAPGGSVNGAGCGDLISILSNNAGDGGNAQSGSGEGGDIN